MTDLDDWLAAGGRPEADVPICLVGDLAARYQVASEELLRLSADPNRSLEDTALVEVLARVEDLQRQMVGATRVFRLRALDPMDYLRLQITWPARDNEPLDARNGVNVEEFLPALVKASAVDPVLSDEQWDTLRSKLSSRQWDELWVTAQQLNREDVRPPKSLGSFGPTPTSGAKRKQPVRSASRSNGSAGGNRKRSTPTTTKAG